MKDIKILIWDIDGTVLNFLEAEKAAIRTGFKRFNMGECTDEMLANYSRINREYWQKLERGEMEKADILVNRYKDFFSMYGLDVSLAESFNDNYQVDLGDTVCFNDNSYELIEELNGRFKQYCATNGTKIAQYKKLRVSGLDKLFSANFISDEIGYEKPSKEFFDFALEKIREDYGEFSKDEVLIIGDSLTSDIKGGNNAGIKTCWYNPGAEESCFVERIVESANGDMKYNVDITVKDLNELLTVLE